MCDLESYKTMEETMVICTSFYELTNTELITLIIAEYTEVLNCSSYPN